MVQLSGTWLPTVVLNTFPANVSAEISFMRIFLCHLLRKYWNFCSKQAYGQVNSLSTDQKLSADPKILRNQLPMKVLPRNQNRWQNPHETDFLRTFGRNPQEKRRFPVVGGSVRSEFTFSVLAVNLPYWYMNSLLKLAFFMYVNLPFGRSWAYLVPSFSNCASNIFDWGLYVFLVLKRDLHKQF